MTILHVRRICSFLLLVYLTFMVSSCAPIVNELFTYLPENTTNFTPLQAELWEQYLNEPTTDSISLISLDTAKLAEGVSVGLEFPDGAFVSLTSISISVTTGSSSSPQTYLWRGTDVSEKTIMSLAVQDSDVTGVINTEAEVYMVRPLRQSLHALILTDPQALPPEHPPGWDAIEDQPEDTAAQDPLPPSPCHDPVITVMVVYTTEGRTS